MFGVAAASCVAPPLADARPAGVREHDARRCPRSACSCPSRSIVARTCSEPGVTSSGTRRSAPCALACSRDVGGAAHVLVRGVRAAADQRRRDAVDGSRSSRSATSAASCESGRARSGECGPDDVRLERARGRARTTCRSASRARPRTSGSGCEQRAVLLGERRADRRAPVASR